MTDLDQFAQRLEELSSVAYALGVVTVLAEAWTETSRSSVEVDTGFAQSQTGITSLSGNASKADATVESRAVYAGYLNRDGSGFFDAGMLAAENIADSLEADLGTEIRRVLDGGAPNPYLRGRGRQVSPRGTGITSVSSSAPTGGP